MIDSKLELVTDVDTDFDWQPLFKNQYMQKGSVGVDTLVTRLYLQPSDTAKNPILCIKFGINILNFLGASIIDKLLLLEDKNNPKNFLLVKSPNGAKIAKIGKREVFYSVQYRIIRPTLPKFNSTPSTYFKNSNGTVRFILPC